MSGSEQRFFVDERGGCIAVRDRENTNPEDQGLHEETRGVVFYRHGRINRTTCPTCHQEHAAGWMVPQESIDEAHRVCSELNAKTVKDYVL